MPRHPHHRQDGTEPQIKVAPEEPTVRRISSDTLELTPAVVKHAEPETFELAKDDPLTAAVNAALGPASDPPGTPEVNPANRPEVVQPKTVALAVGDKPLSQMTREELIARLGKINEQSKVARPLNETPHERPAMTERQMTQREAELARGAERVAANQARPIAPRPPLTALTPGRQDPLPKPPLPVQTVVVEPTMAQGRAEPDGEYVPDMNHGYIVPGKNSPADYKVKD
jgi:hypothetical protein